jgi:hypothetical protein
MVAAATIAAALSVLGVFAVLVPVVVRYDNLKAAVAQVIGFSRAREFVGRTDR